MSDKPFNISRWTVRDAYDRVRANKGAPGYDQIDFDAFERNLNGNLYKIWNRLSSGTCFPPPVLAVQIPKKNGKTRTLGIPTIEDRVAQTAAAMVIEARLDNLFVEDSYGYRPGKSATDAVGVARERCFEHPYVTELDIKGLFDNIDHELLMRAVDMHVKEKWIRICIERWLKAPFVDRDGNITPRTCGTPQGGSISPLLANLFMHYAFDVWMRRHHPEAPFERYADDALIHCATREEAAQIKAELAARFSECRLEMNEEKTRIACCSSWRNTNPEPVTSFDFLGCTFGPMHIKCRDGAFRKCTVVRASKQAHQSLRQKVRALRLHRKSGSSMETIAGILNPIVRGWINYYNKYAPSSLRSTLRVIEGRIIRWAMRKHKNLRGHWRRARLWLDGIRAEQPKLFAHWDLLYGTKTG